MKKIAVALLALIMCFTFAACSSPSPTDALKADLENAKSSPDEIIGDMGSDGFGEEATEALVDKVLEFDYELGEESIDGDTATVEATITTYPFGEMFSNLLISFMGEALADPTMTEETMMDTLDQLLMDALDSAEKTYESTVTVTLVNDGEAWVVQESDELSNALTGGMLDFANSASSLS